ncbi:heavy-metal-associated domain-containing protein [Algibacter sp. Ld11]|uniref:heavy-metal-associated domain-containing protein n=1 Tax=Algibacter sp. Ld11 TaxID=649150 RepID=UPI0038676224
MIHTYNVAGMTCNGCRTSVEEKLNAMPLVKKAAVTLENSEAVIEMHSHIPLENFQNVLSNKYTIVKSEANNAGIVATEQSELKQLFPLFLIFGYISVAALLLNTSPWNVTGFMLDFMGLFYVVFSFFKLLDLKGFPESFKMYDPLAKAIPSYGWIYPFIEVVLGIMFLMRIEVMLALVATLVILGITTIGVVKTLLDKKSIQCACLGTALKLPMTKATFIENSIMIIMAITMLVMSW